MARLRARFPAVSLGWMKAVHLYRVDRFHLATTEVDDFARCFKYFNNAISMQTITRKSLSIELFIFNNNFSGEVFAV